MASSIVNLIIIFFSLLNRLLADGWAIDLSNESLGYCRFRYYIVYVTFHLSPYMNVLATIDRYCSSSKQAKCRRWSTRKVAYYVVPSTVLLFLLLFLHILICFQIERISATTVLCKPNSGIYTHFFGYYTLIIYCLSLFLLILFGILTLVNIKRQHHRIMPVIMTNRLSTRQTDGQLLRMLLFQVITYIILVLPYNTTLVWTTLVDSNNVVAFTTNITRFPLFLSYSTSFYVYTLTNRLYRKEFFTLLNLITQRLFARTIVQRITSTVMNTTVADIATIAHTKAALNAKSTRLTT
ncbi:unnamed protein product [Didymodactylos carnosus]|uniref:G-protein coupled receptors family 1 profile domain-containing protein n=1 Tax=Didymodactylos carnosus TaxID=1234261 RepID=A0A814F9G4_9BILA|nr:unnamed protein product [Didymodactylos carnosus]CAF3749624.1 unnamed protein product [Didymodactylos carnosus]